MKDQRPAVHVHDTVHRRVPVFGIVPNISDDEAAGFGRVSRFGELGEILEAEVKGHVESPTIDPLVAQIALHHGVWLGVDVVLDFRIFYVEFGKIVDIQPADGLIGLIFTPLEEVAPGTCGVLLCFLKVWASACPCG